MKTILLALTIAALAAPAHAAEIQGAWTAERIQGDSVQFELSRVDHHHSDTRRLTDFAGLPAGVLDAAAQTPVRFTLQRDAGNFSFEGTFRNGLGAGQFTFTPNPAYAAALRNLGVAFEDGEPGDDRLLTFAWLDVSSAYIRAMQAEGYSEFRAHELVAARIHRVTPEFIEGLKRAGYDHIPLRKLVAMRIHGIDGDYVKRMNAAR